MPGSSESDKFMRFSSDVDFPKMGILEVDKSPSWPKMATMRISQKRECWKKSAVATVKVASGPQTFPLRSHEGPSWAQDEFLEKYGFPLGAKMHHFPSGKWAPGKHKIFLESLLHMVHVLQSSQKLRLASKKSSIFSGAIFPADVREIRHTKFCLKWLLGPSWAHLCF